MPGIAWKRWKWVEWGLVPLVSTAMVAAWVSPLFQFILGLSIVYPRDTVYPGWLVVVLLLGASATKSVLPKTSGGRAASSLIGVVVTLAVLLSFSPFREPSAALPLAWVGRTLRTLAEWQEAIPATFLLIIMTTALWARGLAADWAAHDELWRAFAVGVLVLGALVLLSGRAGAAQMLPLGQAIIAFLVCGLLALALLAALDVLSIQQPFGKRAASLNRYWLLALLLALLAILFFGWVFGRALAPEAVAQFVRWLDPLRRFVGQILSLVLTVIAYVFFTVILALYDLLSRWIGQPEVDTAQFMKAAEDLRREAQEGTRSLNIPPDLRLILVLLLFFMGAALLFWLLWRQRHRRVGSDQVVEERQSIGSMELLLEQLRKLLQRAPHVHPFLDLSSTPSARRAIRLLYQRVLAEARSIGHPRAKGQTPLSYERSLARLLPTRSGELHTLTEAYISARYGEQDPTDEVVSGAGDAAARIEQVLRQHRAS